VADFTDLVEMASERVGGAVLATNDDFFAEKENLIRAHAPVWDEHRYTDRGKWMDGWESRRRREAGDDWVVVRLGLAGVVRGVVVDTANFKGNYPEQCSIEAASAPPGTPAEAIEGWREILPRSALKGDSRNVFSVRAPFRATHVRLRIYPDGGVARLRVHGEVVPDWERLLRRPELDLAAAENGASVPLVSDMFFGTRHNLIAPGRPKNMGEGWETRRRRGSGNDWAIVRLATQGIVQRAEVDTTFFKGNSPGWCSLEGARAQEGPWQELLPRTALLPHTRHPFDRELAAIGPVNFVRLQIYPDGGVARLYLWGAPSAAGREGAGLRWLDTLLDPGPALTACCAARRWVTAMAERRPFRSLDGLLDTSDEIWSGTGPEDWHEAFAAHPRIGERKGSAWSAEEQAGAAGAEARFLEANRAYEARFGHIFIVCATGRSADEMLALLHARIDNDREREIRVAAEEQRKITRLRLQKLVNP
jgi:allantoicase